MSGSCIHIFLLLIFDVITLAWITGLIVLSSLAVGTLIRTLNVWHNASLIARGSLQIGYRQTRPHIGWMLFENAVKTVDV